MSEKKSFSGNARWLIPPVPEQSQVSVSQWFVYRTDLHVKATGDCSLKIAVDSKYWLYVNGALVLREGGLKRGPVPDGSYYDVLDISEFVQPGENQIAVLLWYFGRHGFAHRDSEAPGLLMDADGGDLRGWKVRQHPAYFDAGYVRDGYRLAESSVGFDARHAHDEWFQPEYDDAEWSEPVRAGKAGALPWGQLEERPVPQWQWGERCEYEEIDRQDDGAGYWVYRCKLPYNLFFVPCLEVGPDGWKAAGGSAIEIIPTLLSNCLKAVYIAKDGEQSFEFPGWLASDEVVYRVPKDVSVRKLSYRKTAYPAALLDTFSCDDPELNRFCEMAQRTLMLTMRDNFMDCPCRERAQWPGDFVIQLAQLPYAMSTEGQLLARKAFRELFRWQRPDGTLYGPVPEGNWKMELPAQMLAVVSAHGPWLYWMHTGDLELIKEVFPAANRYVDVWELDGRGLVKYRPQREATPVKVDGVECGGWDWLDWGERIDQEVLLNMWTICALEGVALMAKCIGNMSKHAELRVRADRLRDVVNREYWQEERGAYATEDWPHDPDDRVQAMAILSGTAPESRRPQLLEWMLKVQQASPYMEKYVLESLFEIGAGCEAIQRLKIRYKAMLDSGKSSLWEFFYEDLDGTFNHSWSGGPMALLVEKVAGVFPLEAGWQSFAVRPNPCGLRQFSVEASTPLGLIRFSATCSDVTWEIRLSVPAGAIAKLDLTALGGGVFDRGEGDWDICYDAGSGCLV